MQAESADRVYVVRGHYDSRCTDVLNFTFDAPGADDASGVAAVLDLAPVMAKHPLDATVVFIAVAGDYTMKGDRPQGSVPAATPARGDRAATGGAGPLRSPGFKGLRRRPMTWCRCDPRSLR
jgi:hypothetical protein